ncbi:hypothetical protein ACIB24_21060 [Spongisporangium articulatum]|uniref:DUF3558 domain-containing protein n=1 Tax=Spongisporangium articulatum TaxID=3362603 RepID=A0ABW8AT57_9ACTN
MRRDALTLTVAVLAVSVLTACGSASSAGGGPAAPSGSAATGSEPSGTTSASAGASASASADGGGSGGKGSSSSSGGGLGGYAAGVGSGPASTSCTLTAAQVGAVLGEPVRATSEDSSDQVLACYYRTTASTSTSSLTVTVEKVAVAGLYKQSRKANAAGGSTQSGGLKQKCSVKDTTFDGHSAFTTTCTTSPDKQRVGGLQWDYSGGRFFHVSAVAVGRKDRTPAQLLTVSQKLAKALVA